MKTIIVSLIALMLLGCASSQLPDRTSSLFQEKFTSIKTGDYELFIKDGTKEFKKIPKKDFLAVSNNISSKLEKKYILTYLSSISRKVHTSYLWKLSIENESDEYLFNLVINNKNQVSGFWVR